jgi:hypothetical protein
MSNEIFGVNQEVEESLVPFVCVVAARYPVEAKVNVRIGLAAIEHHRVGTVRDHVSVAVFGLARSLVLRKLELSHLILTCVPSGSQSRVWGCLPSHACSAYLLLYVGNCFPSRTVARPHCRAIRARENISGPTASANCAHTARFVAAASPRSL